MQNKFNVPADTTDELYEQLLAVLLEDRIPALKRDPDARNHAFTAEMVCGPEVWATLESAVKKAGKCIKTMVDRGQLPLRPVKKKQQYPLMYELN